MKKNVEVADKSNMEPPDPQDSLVAPQKPIDANRYATKKTIAQGMLDIALLTANASQLKYILQVGAKHEFYKLMVGLISTSIVLQVIAGIFILLLSQTDITKPENKLRAAWLNHLLTSAVTGFMLTDILKMVFGLDPAVKCVDEKCSNLYDDYTYLFRTNFTGQQ